MVGSLLNSPSLVVMNSSSNHLWFEYRVEGELHALLKKMMPAQRHQRAMFHQAAIRSAIFFCVYKAEVPAADFLLCSLLNSSRIAKTREKISTTMPCSSKITAQFPSSIVTMTKTSTTQIILFHREQKWQQRNKCGFVTVIGAVPVGGRMLSAVMVTTSKLICRAPPGVAGERWKQPLV
jgi:hypothetical protein